MTPAAIIAELERTQQRQSTLIAELRALATPANNAGAGKIVIIGRAGRSTLYGLPDDR